ncbi:MAG: hypothetical protein IRY83_08435 [Chloroflexi bacterium]|nr:hypothetical protein [Chloroflexota bacterium]
MGRLRNRPRTPPTGQQPRIWKPKLPVIPEADLPEGQEPMVVEPPTKGITVDSDIPTEPGRPRAAIPWRPGAATSERQRTPRTGPAGGS